MNNRSSEQRILGNTPQAKFCGNTDDKSAILRSQDYSELSGETKGAIQG